MKKSTPRLELLPEKVAGKRFKMVSDFQKYRLGSKTEVKNLLEAHGATLLPTMLREPFDFYLGGYQWENSGHSGSFHRPVVFEEELCAPTASGPLARLKPRLWDMMRVLLSHPQIHVSRLWLGQPLDEAGLDKLERKWGSPLPALLREFYQQVGELRLFWYFKLPHKKDHPWLRKDQSFLPDAHENHDGVINIFDLARVLGDEWHEERYYFDLGPNQQMFDFYSVYHMTAVELGTAPDPLLHIGGDHGVSFSWEKPVALSDYLRLLLDSYGTMMDPRNRPPEEFPVDLDNKANLHTQQELNWLLNTYADWAEWVPTTYEARYFALLDFARQHRPQFSVVAYHEQARHNWRRSRLLNLPQYQALLPGRRPELDLAVRNVYTEHPATFGALRIFNTSPEPLLVQHFTLELLAVVQGQELRLAHTDSEQPQQPHKVASKRDLRPVVLPEAQPLPATIAPYQTLALLVALQGPDARPALAAHGVADWDAFYKDRPVVLVRGRVTMDTGQVLTADYELLFYY